MRSCGIDNLLPITHPMVKSHRPMKWRTLPPRVCNLLERILYQRTPSNERSHKFFSKSVCRNSKHIENKPSTWRCVHYKPSYLLKSLYSLCPEKTATFLKFVCINVNYVNNIVLAMYCVAKYCEIMMYSVASKY